MMQKGFAHLLLLIAGFSVAVFLVVVNFAPLKNNLLARIFDKPSSFAATDSTPWNGVPPLVPNYSQDVETWWNAHPFNPAGSSYKPNISSPANQIDVQTQYGSNLGAAISACPASGCTLKLKSGTYNAANLVGKNNLHIIGDPGSNIKGSMFIAGCQQGIDDYPALNVGFRWKEQWAIDCLTTGRITNVYIKGVTFVGNPGDVVAFHIRAAKDILLDGDTFKDYTAVLSGHPGYVVAGVWTDNIVVRNSTFQGADGNWAIYFDGCHGCVILNNNTAGLSTRTGTFLALTNDDFSGDANKDGNVDDGQERRMTQYLAMVGNTSSSTSTFTSNQGAHILAKDNTVNGLITNFYYQNARSPIQEYIRSYDFFDNVVKNNYVQSVTNFATFRADPAAVTDCSSRSIPVDRCMKLGKFTVSNNGGGSVTRWLVEEPNGMPMLDPRTQSGNCIGCNPVNQQPSPLPSPTVIASPSNNPSPVGTISTQFPLGMFEDGNVTWGKTTDFSNMIADLKAHNLDSVMFVNNNTDRDLGMLSVSDSQNFNVYFSPLGGGNDLNDKWWNNPVAATLQNARNVVYPIVDQLKTHSSVKGYYIADEPDEKDAKVPLTYQAFNERDPNNQPHFTFIGLNNVPALITKTNPKTVLLDVYPIAENNPACDYSMGAFGYNLADFQSLGYPDDDFVNYIRAAARNKPANTPLWIILQAHGNVAGLRTPSVAELRAQNWMSVGEGATGIFWFIYSSQQGWVGLKDSPTLFNEVSTFSQTISPLRPTLLTLHKISDQYTVSGPLNPYISTLSTADGSKKYIVVVNRGSCSTNQNLTINSSTGGSLKNSVTGQTSAFGSAISFLPGEGKIFEVIGASASIAPSAQPSIAPSPANGLSAAPTVTVSVSCITTNYSGSGVNISWVNPAGGNQVNYADISSEPSFATFYNKAVSGTSTTAPNGFGHFANGSPLVLNPGITYYARLFNNDPQDRNSTATSFTIPACSAKPGDIDGNGKVDIFDYNLLITNFGKTGSSLQGDLDGNNKVDIFDYNIVVSNFGN